MRRYMPTTPCTIIWAPMAIVNIPIILMKTPRVVLLTFLTMYRVVSMMRAVDSMAMKMAAVAW